MVMSDMTIEDLVRKYIKIIIPAKEGSWNRVYCELCGDGEGRTKGPRGGWLFTDNKAFYNCFNRKECEGSFDPDREFPYGKEMWNVLRAFGIPEDEHKAIAYANRGEGKAFAKPAKREVQINTIKMPDHFYKLVDAKPENVIAQKAIRFLWEEKRIRPDQYDFYLSTGISMEGPREVAIARSMAGKIIIPYFKKDQLIYYQARGLDKKIYINASAPLNSVIYGFDKLHADLSKPLFITEGFWDAFHVDGVSVLTNSMTSQQMEILSKSPRRKIVIPDKKDDSQHLANQALDLGWEVALPDIGSCKDVTEAILLYGKIYVLNSINSNIFSGFQASINLKLY